MKKTTKSVRSLIIAAAVCAGLAFSIVSSVSAPNTAENAVAATRPGFCHGIY